MNDSPIGVAANGSVPERIASCAAAAPLRVAVVDDVREMNYEQLERETNALAEHLRAAGAGPERCVGLFLERSTQFVVAALAVLKSGAAYVPLDVSAPPDRVSSILTDAGVVALVTDGPIANDVPEGSWPVLRMDRLSADGATASGPVEIDLDSLAYLVYTSGSTGEPKGVEITHANLCNLIDWHQSAFAVTPGDRASHVASLGFDAAGWEIWPYLTAGASVSIADESTRRSAELLRRWLVSRGITIGFVPTALAEELFRADWPAETNLRVLLTGGDTLRRRPPAGLPFSVVNNYGPTECTVVATSGPVSPDAEDSGKPSIGRPITDATAFILDEALQPVAPGESGELCIGGALVARGYRNMPELTAERFVSYATPSGERLRLYRSGDRARVLESGELEFLGRFDDQVKIRGHRIELGEIEARLSQHSEIVAGAVSVSDSPSGPMLVAYVVPAEDGKLTERDLRKYLAAKLPEYMLPALFVSIRALPVLASGKLDRAALPAPGADNLLPRAPETNGNSARLEREIAALVASLMSREGIDANENFFMIGGHSMLGVQLVARIRETFGVQLPLRQLFTAPTVRELSNEVSRMLSVD